MQTFRQLLTIIWCAIILAFTAFNFSLLRSSMESNGAVIIPALVIFGLIGLLAVISLADPRGLWALAGAQLLLGVLRGVSGMVSFWTIALSILTVCISLGLAFWAYKEKQSASSLEEEF